jgi:hypothetical protein
MIRFYLALLLTLAVLIYFAMSHCPAAGLISYLHC